MKRTAIVTTFMFMIFPSICFGTSFATYSFSGIITESKVWDNHDPGNLDPLPKLYPAQVGTPFVGLLWYQYEPAIKDVALDYLWIGGFRVYIGDDLFFSSDGSAISTHGYNADTESVGFIASMVGGTAGGHELQYGDGGISFSGISLNDLTIPYEFDTFSSGSFYAYSYGPMVIEARGQITSVSRIFTPPVPEPATLILFGIGLVGLAGASFRKNRKNSAKLEKKKAESD